MIDCIRVNYVYFNRYARIVMGTIYGMINYYNKLLDWLIRLDANIYSYHLITKCAYMYLAHVV